MVGAHNALNALAVIAIAEEMEVPLQTVREALSQFGGVQRRFTVRGEVRGISVVDDYGHHPAEVRATLAGARRAFGRRVVVVFQPHRYTRTRDLLSEFATAFNDADLVVVTEVYAAGEEPIAGVNGKTLADALVSHGHPNVVWVQKRVDVAASLAPMLKEGDLVLTLGAGDVTQVGPDLLKVLGV
jgi:UDP-N-acetylmuramate--alanine ligase